MIRYLFTVMMVLIVCDTAQAQEPGRYRPVITGDWQLLYSPVEYGGRVNDHTVFQDASGQWRFVGICSYPLRDLTTPYLCHATGPTPDARMASSALAIHSSPHFSPRI